MQNRNRLRWLQGVCQANAQSKREQAEKKFHFHPSTYAAKPESETALIDQPLLNPSVSINPPVTQERPVGPISIDCAPIDLGHDNLFALDWTFGDDLPIGPANKTLSPEFNSVATGRRFMSDSVGNCYITSIRDGVTALNCFPGGVLRFSKFFLLARVPPDRRRIENNFRSAQRR